jgi:hypothetical protein
MKAQTNASPFRLSFPILTAAALLHTAIILTLTFLFCWGFGCYTLRKSTDALFTIAFCYTLVGLMFWVGRALRFYYQSEAYTSILRMTDNDLPALSIPQRRWLLIVYENRLAIPWTAAGILTLLAAILFGSILSAQFPPDTILSFLVRDNLPPIIRPGGILAP